MRDNETIINRNLSRQNLPVIFEAVDLDPFSEELAVITTITQNQLGTPGPLGGSSRTYA